MNDTHNTPSPTAPSGSPTRSSTVARLILLASFALSLALPTALLIGAQPPAPATALEQAQGCVPTVIAYGQVNVRSGPSTQFEPPIGALFAGQTAQVTGRLSDNSWYRIIFSNREGWVFGQIVQTSCMQNVPVVPNPPLPPGPTPMPNQANFVATPTVITPPQCSTLSWNITEVAGVWLISGGYQQGVGGVDSRQVCPTTTTTYTLLVQRRDGTTYQQGITVNVIPPQPNDPNFRADAYSVNPGGCTTLRWNVSNVRAVFLWDGGNQQGVGGNDSRQVCPLNTSTYRLQVIGADGVSRDYFLTINVTGGVAAPSVNFYAESNALPRGQCTNLRWQVSDQFSAIVLIDASVNSTTVVGPNGDIKVCPNQSVTYILRVTGVDGRLYDTPAQVTVFAAGPTPIP